MDPASAAVPHSLQPAAMNRIPSETPEDAGRSLAQILEWNFLASRINGIVAMMRAHERYNIPLNLHKIAVGMSLEMVRRLC